MKVNFKVDSKGVIIFLVILIIGIVSFGLSYCFFSPSPINRYIASNIYKTPANSAFVDDNFYNCVVDAYNNANHTSVAYTTNLSDNQLQTIKTLQCSGFSVDEGNKIKDTSGIEKLLSLTSLGMDYNLLTELDLSNNRELTSLDIYSNQLENLDVSKNTNLMFLSAQNNKLTALDLSSNIRLRSVHVQLNQLNRLDVSGLVELGVLVANSNQLSSLDVNSNTKLITLSVEKNQLTELDVSNNTALEYLSAYSNELTSLDVSKNTALTKLSAYSNQLTSLDVSNNPALITLDASSNRLTNLNLSRDVALKNVSVSGNQITSLDVSNNSALDYLSIASNQLTSLVGINHTKLRTLIGDDNQLTSIDISSITSLEYLSLGHNQLTSLDVSNNLALTDLSVHSNQLTSLDVSKNTALKDLEVSYNRLNSLDLSKNVNLEKLKISDNPYGKLLKPVLVNDTVHVISFSSVVKLPIQIIPVYEQVISFGLKLDADNLIATKIGTQTYKIFSSNPDYKETYTIEVVDITSDKYMIDKTKDYIEVGSDTDEEVLNHITIENGEASIEGEELIVKNGEDVVKRFKLIRIESSVYDLSNSYIYVGVDTDEEIINQIETNANMMIENNMLKVQYSETDFTSYMLIRLDTNYDLSNHYLYTLDTDILDKIDVVNGDKNIENSNIVISYNGEEVDRIPILTITSDLYDITKDYIYTRFRQFNLDRINKSDALELNIYNHELEIKYQDTLLDGIPIYTLNINSNKIRVSSKSYIIYVSGDINYFDFINSFIWNTTNEDMKINLYNGNKELVTDGTVTEGYSIEVLYKNHVIDNYIIQYRQEYVEYQEGLQVKATDEYGIDILKNLSIQNTFQDIRSLIETDGVITIQDKDNKELDVSSKVKTGDKFVVTFSESNYLIYLSIKGDVTGTGSIGLEDVLKSYQILRGESVDEYYKLASDINEDGLLKVNDVAKLYQYTENKIESLGN